MNQTPTPQISKGLKSYAEVTKNNVNQTKNHESNKNNTKPKFKPKPHVLFVGDSVMHHCDFKKLSVTTNCAIKTRKAYSSTYDHAAWFPDSNIQDVTFFFRFVTRILHYYQRKTTTTKKKTYRQYM